MSERRCHYPGCTGMYAEGRRGPYARLCPIHANARGLIAMRDGVAPDLISAVYDASGVEQRPVAAVASPLPSDKRRADRLRLELDISTAARNVVRAERDLTAARGALRNAVARSEQ